MMDGAPVDEYRERAIRQAPPEMAEAVQAAFDQIAHFHANPVPRRPDPFFIPPDMTQADRLCRVCRGFGTLYDHYSDGFTSAGRCHVCDGRGFR